MSGRSKFPFTANQWQELEHQALIFKYMVSGMPIPPDLLFTVKKSLDSSLSSKLLHHQPQHIGWNCFQMGFGGKFDPEPGRCRRTDGKKWRCSKEAYPDSKYCERHMHRGRNRSRKPVEAVVTNNNTNTATTTQTNNYPLKPPSAPPIPISSISKNLNNTLSPPASSLSESTHPFNHHFLYPDHSSQGNTTRLLLDSGPCSIPERDYRYGYGMKDEVDEHAFFSESPGTVRRDSGSSMEDPWQLTMGSSVTHLKQRTACSGLQTENNHYQFLGGDQFRCERDDDKPQKKVMHHFLDEWPGEKSSNFGTISTTQLSISMPNTSNDLFMTIHGGN